MTDLQNDYFAGEQLTLVRDESLGLRAAIAINSTTLGPALGGVRYVRYPSVDDGVVEAQRLAAAMTLKNAVAGLPYGGGKAVIFDERPVDREPLMRRFGEFVSRLHGAYIPGVDMGTTTQDLAAMSAGGADVSCDEHDPSPSTARGVYEALAAAAAYRFGQGDLAGLRVLVQGVGHVGGQLARLCADSGARVSVSDVDPARAAQVADSVHGHVVAPDAVLTTPTDVFAPCAKARVIDAVTARTIPASIIVGAANDTLADDGVAAELARRGVLYVPDFVANAGGVIHIHALRSGWERPQLDDAVTAIGDRVRDLLTTTSPDADLLTKTYAHAQTILAGAADH